MESVIVTSLKMTGEMPCPDESSFRGTWLPVNRQREDSVAYPLGARSLSERVKYPTRFCVLSMSVLGFTWLRV